MQPPPSSSDPSGAAPIDDDPTQRAAEQAVLDQAYRCLDSMQRRADATLAMGDRAVRDEDTVDAKVAKYHLERRVRDLRVGRGPLCFGRIDEQDGPVWHVGRRHVEDEHGRPVIVDWRAPVAAPFYRATAIDPLGLTFRRRFSVEDRIITGMFDEDLTDPASVAVGVPDPLLAELERSRSGTMSDIVATIAAEQDHIIRAPLDRLLVVQGGPGTGKTAVGLHRAAYLLFEHREQLMESRVLVVGPNPVFLRYIADVLPSLGETSVRQATVADLLAARYRVRGTDPGDVRAVKGSGSMAAVVDRAARSRIVVPDEGLEVKSGLAVVRLSADDLALVLKPLLESGVPLNQGRDVARRLVLAEAWRRHRKRPGVDPASEPGFTAGVSRDSAFTKAFDKMWPRLDPAAVVRGLFASPRRLARASQGLLTGDQQALLRRSGSGPISREPWTAADIPILDEADFICNGATVGYGHIVVDEAQDLSPMALRMIARRAVGGSMTVLGDRAQATNPDATDSWVDAVGHLTSAATGRSEWLVDMAELTVGYRVPAAILDHANRLLVQAAPEVTPARSVRRGGEPTRIHTVATEQELWSTVGSEVRWLRDRGFSTAVIVSDAAAMEAGADALAALGLGVERISGSRAGAGLPGADAVAVLHSSAAKGLEFDAVVVVEPGVIAQLPSGLRHLYVAMTRAVKYLALVHTNTLPGLLTDRPG